MSIQEDRSKIYQLIDNLKAVCTSTGLGNSGGEYKIITEAFLYKFLNDKFLYAVRKTQLQFKGLPAREVEKKLETMSGEEFEMLSIDLPEGTAIIQPENLISTLFQKRAEKDFHTTLDKALSNIAEDNKDVFSVSAGEGNAVKLFEPLSNYVIQNERKDEFASAVVNALAAFSFDTFFGENFDFFADIFEYLIADYNKDNDTYAEYYTPHVIAKIIAQILAPNGDSNVEVYDPAAGSGTLVLTLAEQIGAENCTIYAQDISQKSNEILRLNLILNNLVDSLPHVIQDDTLRTPRHLAKDGKSIKKFDYIVSNPPFNMDFSETRNLLAGENYSTRFFAGVPNILVKQPKKMSIYLLFIQHIITSLKEKTGRAAIVVPTGFLTASGIGLKIRKYIVNHHMLRAVVSMPSNIFANTGTNVSVLFLDANGSPEDDALLVDASKLGEKVKIEGTKNQRTVLANEEIKQIIETVQERQEKEDFSVLVPMEDIKKKKYSFLASQYFNVNIEYSPMTADEFTAKIDQFSNDLQTYFDKSHILEKNIHKCMEGIIYE